MWTYGVWPGLAIAGCRCPPMSMVSGGSSTHLPTPPPPPAAGRRPPYPPPPPPKAPTTPKVHLDPHERKTSAGISVTAQHRASSEVVPPPRRRPRPLCPPPPPPGAQSLLGFALAMSATLTGLTAGYVSCLSRTLPENEQGSARLARRTAVDAFAERDELAREMEERRRRRRRRRRRACFRRQPRTRAGVGVHRWVVRGVEGPYGARGRTARWTVR